MKTKPKKTTAKKAIIIRKEWPRVRDLTPTGKKLFIVDARPHGKREGFTSEEDAITRAEQLALEVENKGTEAVAFPTHLRVMAQECIAKLEPFGKTLREATEHFVKWLQSEKHRSESRLVTDCVEEYLTTRRAEVERGDLARTSLYEVIGRMKVLRGAFGGAPIMTISEDKVRSFLDSMPVSARTRINTRLRMSHFFNFCKRKGWIDANPVVEISIKAKSGDVKILSVEETTALLKAAVGSKHPDVTIPYAAISLFAGLRPGEADQLRWEQVHFDTNTIEVLRHTSKTRDTRFVPIDPTLKAWLEPHRRKAGQIVGANFRKTWEAVKRKAAEIRKEQSGTEDDFMFNNIDVMRHTYASYWLALHKNRTELAEHMGNSVVVIKKHYRRPILEATARAYWKLTPQAVTKA